MEPIKPLKGKSRRTLMDIPGTVPPAEIYDLIVSSPGWPYKRDSEKWLVRDRSLPALLYVAELRISEACRLVRNQFEFNEDAGIWEIKRVKLSKERQDKPRAHPFREVIKLPSDGERAKFTDLVMKWVKPLAPKERPYPFKFGRKNYWTKGYTDSRGNAHPREQRVGEFVSSRGLQIIYSLTGGKWDENLGSFRSEGALWNHYFRAQGERFLYRKRQKDIFRVAREVRVDPRTLIKYLESGETEEVPV